MFKIGLKLYSTNHHYVQEAARLVEQGFCDYIELLIIPGSYQEHATAWVNLNVSFVIHAPCLRQGFNLAQKDFFQTNMQIAKEVLQFADTLKADKIIFHPGIAGEVEETVRQLKVINDSRIVIENLPKISLEKDLPCNGHSPEEIAWIMKETGVGFCLDAGHAVYAANAQGVNQIDYLKQFLLLNPTMFHLTDGDWDGVYDKHEHLGTGSFELKNAIQLVPMNSAITLETKHDYQDSLRDFEQDVFYLRNLEKSSQPFLFRPATKDDAKVVYDLSTDALVRQQSFNSNPIAWEEHIVWFENKLSDNQSKFYIVQSQQNDFIGYVRFEKTDQDYVITIHLAELFRGKGLGTSIINQATALFLAQHPYATVVAFIKHTNVASIKSFLKAGYQHSQDCVVNEVASGRFVMQSARN